MDKKLLFLINHEWIGPGLDRWMAIMSSAAFWGVPLALLALYAAWRGGFRGRTFVVVAVLAFGLNDGVVGRILKKSVGRPRPYQTEEGVRKIDLKAPAWRNVFSPLKEEISTAASVGKPGNSFPSNHSSNTAAVATVAVLVWRRRGWWAFVPALAVAYSRVYVGAHWPSDALAGTLIGSAVALLTAWLAQGIWRRWGTRLAPQTAAAHPALFSNQTA